MNVVHVTYALLIIHTGHEKGLRATTNHSSREYKNNGLAHPPETNVITMFLRYFTGVYISGRHFRQESKNHSPEV
jgi:hypothetical protein